MNNNFNSNKQDGENLGFRPSDFQCNMLVYNGMGFLSAKENN